MSEREFSKAVADIRLAHDVNDHPSFRRHLNSIICEYEAALDENAKLKDKIDLLEEMAEEDRLAIMDKDIRCDTYQKMLSDLYREV